MLSLFGAERDCANCFVHRAHGAAASQSGCGVDFVHIQVSAHSSETTLRYMQTCISAHAQRERRCRRPRSEVREEFTPWVMISRDRWATVNGDIYDCEWGTLYGNERCERADRESARPDDSDDVIRNMQRGFCPCRYSSIGAEVGRHLRNNHPNSPSPKSTIFVLAQFWGHGYGHFLPEALPRLMIFLDVLRAHPDILIHVGSEVNDLMKGVFALLGISPNRLFKPDDGDWDHFAQVLISPMNALCGRTHVHLARSLNGELTRRAEAKFPSLPSSPRRVIIIRRTVRRQMPGWDDMIKFIRKHFAPVIQVSVYSDDSLPSFDVALQWFNRAHVIIAPHGAGLSNMAFTQMRKAPSAPSIGRLHIPFMAPYNLSASTVWKQPTDIDVDERARRHIDDHLSGRPWLPLDRPAFADRPAIIEVFPPTNWYVMCFTDFGILPDENAVDAHAIAALLADVL